MMNHAFSESEILNFFSDTKGCRYICPQCKKSYSKLYNMRRHLRLECGKAPQFKCPYCPFYSKRNNGIKLHISMKHNDL